MSSMNLLDARSHFGAPTKRVFYPGAKVKTYRFDERKDRWVEIIPFAESFGAQLARNAKIHWDRMEQK